MDSGGSERQLLHLLHGLDRNRFEPILYLLYDTGVLLDELPADVPRFAFWKDFRKPKLNWPGRIHQLEVRHLKQVLVREKIDVVYDRLFHMTLVTGPATRITDTPRVSTIVSPPQYDLERSEKRWVKWKRLSLQRAYKTADALLTVARGTAENAAQYYHIPVERFRVMLSPIDLKRIARNLERTYEGQPFDPSLKHIVAIGRLSDEKGHRYLIEGVAEYLKHNNPDLPPVQLHLVGDGVLRRELGSMVGRLGIESNVIFHGQVSNPFAILRQCHLFCMPSLYEGMPNALLEAMACNVPVVASDTEQGPGELLREQPIGQLVPRSDSHSICVAIRDRFENPNPWLERARLAREYIESNHNMDDWIEAMSQILEQVFDRKLKR